MRILLYLVGTDEDDAQHNYPFTQYTDALAFSEKCPGTNVFSIQAVLDFATLE